MRAHVTYTRAGVRSLPLILCFLLVPGLKAQSDTLKQPSIGQHIFTPVTYSKLPFTKSYFSTHTGIGITSGLVTEPFELQFKGLEGEVTFVEMGFTYQQRVRDRLAVYMDFTLAARAGTELQSMLAQGFNAITSFNIGWHIKLREGKKSQLSMILELQNHKGSFVNLLGFVKDIIEERPNPKLSQTVPALAFATGLRYAYALSETTGFKTSAKLAYGETYTRGENGFAFDAGAGIDLNFYPRFSVPLGLVVTYDITSMPDHVYVEGENSQLIQAKIAYTKATDFSLGIEFNFMKYPFLNLKRPVTVFSAALAARYYF
jgi:hypothetical protein